MPSIDWNSVIDSADGDVSYDVLPAADYVFVISDSELRTTSTGKTMYTVSARVSEGPHRGRTLKHNFVLSPDSPQAMGIFFREMSALGLTVDYFRASPDDEKVVRDLLDRKFRGKVRHRQFNGTDRAEISRITPAPVSGSATPPPPPPESVPASQPSPF